MESVCRRNPTVGSNPTLSAIIILPSPIANRKKKHDLSQVQRAARPQARARSLEIPATPRVSRARLAARANHSDPHAFSQRPPQLVTLPGNNDPRIRRPPVIKRRMKRCPLCTNSKEPAQPSSRPCASELRTIPVHICKTRLLKPPNSKRNGMLCRLSRTQTTPCKRRSNSRKTT